MFVTVYGVVFETLCSVGFVTVYGVLFVMVLCLKHCTVWCLSLYGVVFVTVHGVVFETLYRVMFATVYGVVFVTMYSMLYIIMSICNVSSADSLCILRCVDGGEYVLTCFSQQQRGRVVPKSVEEMASYDDGPAKVQWCVRCVLFSHTQRTAVCLLITHLGVISLLSVCRLASTCSLCLL